MAINKPFTVKGITVFSPKGKAKWCKVKEPDRNFNAKGTFSTELICNPEDPTVVAFIGKLEELRDAAFNEAKETLPPSKAKSLVTKPVYSEELDEDGNETGMIKFKFKLDNVDDKEKGKNKIDVVDGMKRPVYDIPLIGNGSIIRCSAFANPYHMANGNHIGISMSWKSMQLIELEEYTASGGGFDTEDGGYEASGEQPPFDHSTQDGDDY